MSDEPKRLKSHSRFKREDLPEQVRVTVDKYVPRIVEGIIKDITGQITLDLALKLDNHNLWNFPDIAKISLFAKESTMGVWFLPAGILIYGDTPSRIKNSSGETVYTGRTNAVSYPYAMFGFTTDEIREMLMATVEISMLLPINHKEMELNPDDSYFKSIPRVAKSHRIVFNSSEIESLRAMVTL